MSIPIFAEIKLIRAHFVFVSSTLQSSRSYAASFICSQVHVVRVRVLVHEALTRRDGYLS